MQSAGACTELRTLRNYECSLECDLNLGAVSAYHRCQSHRISKAKVKNPSGGDTVDAPSAVKFRLAGSC